MARLLGLLPPGKLRLAPQLLQLTSHLLGLRVPCRVRLRAALLHLPPPLLCLGQCRCKLLLRLALLPSRGCTKGLCIGASCSQLLIRLRLGRSQALELLAAARHEGHLAPGPERAEQLLPSSASGAHLVHLPQPAVPYYCY